VFFFYSYLKAECCGTDGPTDWLEFNSTFKQTFSTIYPFSWPPNCCKRLINFDVADLEGCTVGKSSAMYTKVRKGQFTPRTVTITNVIASKPADDIVRFILSACLSVTLNARARYSRIWILIGCLFKFFIVHQLDKVVLNVILTNVSLYRYRYSFGVNSAVNIENDF